LWETAKLLVDIAIKRQMQMHDVDHETARSWISSERESAEVTERSGSSSGAISPKAERQCAGEIPPAPNADFDSFPLLTIGQGLHLFKA
jgi:hypothetical protein